MIVNVDLWPVLILVLKEDTLRERDFSPSNPHRWVLILVLKEDTLRANYSDGTKTVQLCLNPCSKGRYSPRLHLINYI